MLILQLILHVFCEPVNKHENAHSLRMFCIFIVNYSQFLIMILLTYCLGINSDNIRNPNVLLIARSV